MFGTIIQPQFKELNFLNLNPSHKKLPKNERVHKQIHESNVIESNLINFLEFPAFLPRQIDIMWVEFCLLAHCECKKLFKRSDKIISIGEKQNVEWLFMMRDPDCKHVLEKTGKPQISMNLSIQFISHPCSWWGS